jgi:5-methyltetrahydrofolate--homocysteine methyltransferase
VAAQDRVTGRLRQLQDEVIASGLFEPKVVYGYWPAQSEGNDVVVYDPANDFGDIVRPDSPLRRPTVPRSLPGEVEDEEDRTVVVMQPPREILRFTFPRQKEGRKLCIADFLAPKSSGQLDVLGLSLVTIGDRASNETARLFESGEYTRYLYLHGLSVETAEALAEYLHKLMRAELGIANDDSQHIRDLFHQKYRGSRYSFGYPACPNLEDQSKLFALLKPEETVGVRLTSGFLLEPEQSTSAIVVHHPAAKYFVA